MTLSTQNAVLVLFLVYVGLEGRAVKETGRGDSRRGRCLTAKGLATLQHTAEGGEGLPRRRQQKEGYRVDGD